METVTVEMAEGTGSSIVVGENILSEHWPVNRHWMPKNTFWTERLSSPTAVAWISCRNYHQGAWRFQQLPAGSAGEVNSMLTVRPINQSSLRQIPPARYPDIGVAWSSMVKHLFPVQRPTRAIRHWRKSTMTINAAAAQLVTTLVHWLTWKSAMRCTFHSRHRTQRTDLERCRQRNKDWKYLRTGKCGRCNRVLWWNSKCDQSAGC